MRIASGPHLAVAPRQERIRFASVLGDGTGSDGPARWRRRWRCVHGRAARRARWARRSCRAGPGRPAALQAMRQPAAAGPAPLLRCALHARLAPSSWRVRAKGPPDCRSPPKRCKLPHCWGKPARPATRRRGGQGDLLLLAAGPAPVVHRALDRVRQFLARALGLAGEGRHELLWVTGARPAPCLCLFATPCPTRQVGRSRSPKEVADAGIAVIGQPCRRARRLC
jgi:hypothetical protein